MLPFVLCCLLLFNQIRCQEAKSRCLWSNVVYSSNKASELESDIGFSSAPPGVQFNLIDLFVYLLLS